MTDPEARALGERCAAVMGEWRPGMTDVATATVRYPCHHYDGAIPDLRDAATRGAALEVVRERFGDPRFHLRYSSSTYAWFAFEGDGVTCWRHNGVEMERVEGATEAEAIVAALEAAPR